MTAMISDYESVFVRSLLDILQINSIDLSNKIEMDSLLYINFIVNLENEFNIEFEDEMLMLDAFESYMDILNYIYRKMGKVSEK